MKAAEKSIEQVFEELLPTVYKGFLKGESLTESGDIKVAYASKNLNGIACYVTVGEETLLAIFSAGKCLVYKANLVDEITQLYELEDVTSNNSEVVTKVLEYAASNAPSTLSELETKVKTLYATASSISEVTVNPFTSVTSALSFVFEGKTYYAYSSRPINGYASDVMNITVILDEEGKIVKVSAPEYLFGHGYEYIFHDFVQEEYENGFNGVTNETFNDQALVSGATHTSTAVKTAIKDVLDLFASKGGNE